MLEKAPEDIREWVEEVLSNANYKRFREKILELLEKKKDVIGVFYDNLEFFAKRVMHTRNEYVHHNKRKLSFQKGQELYSATNTLTILFEAYILEIIGFSDEKILELLEAKIKTYLSGWTTLRSIKKQKNMDIVLALLIN